MYQQNDPELPILNGDNLTAFLDKHIRLGFIRKVYSILMVQLLITLCFITLFLYEPNVQKFTEKHSEMFWIALVLIFICLITLICSTEIRRKTPHNFIFLGIFTVAEGFLLGTAAGHYESEEVILAVGFCSVICLGLTVFAMQSKWDFTIYGGCLLVGLVVLLLFGIISLFIPNKVVQIAYASLGSLLFSFYLIYDTQLMMGGKHRYSISPEEYIFAALNLYMDIINLFLYILSIIGNLRK